MSPRRESALPSSGDPQRNGSPGAERGFSTIGRPMRKVDGLAKATGRARYTDDIRLPGMLHGKILRSPHPHARIVAIDTSRAEALEGVHAAVTGRDMPTTYGIIPWTPDEYPLCVDRVRYVGDGVAAVAAVDEDTANAALDLIDVTYEELPAYLDPHEAIAADSGPYIHEPRKPGWNGNITKVVKLAFGDVDAGLEDAHIMVEGDYFFEGTTHTPIEPHCAIGLAEGNGKLTVWSATQVPHYLHRELARVLDVDPAQVRVIQPPVGGAFGGKSEPFDLEFCVAKLSMKTGRPVKILYTREEVFYSHRGRHPFHMRYRTGADRHGMLTAVDSEIVMDGGAYASFGLVTTYYSGQLLTAPYQMPAYRFNSTRAYTNKPACGPKRGHGSVQPRFAFEVQLDRIAERLSIDPIELRRRNFIGSNTRTVNDLRVTSNGFLECLDEVERASDWKRKFRRLPFGRGVGVAGSTYITGTNYPVYPNDMPQSGIQLQVDRSGRVAVFSGASEIGQGVDSMVTYIVAEELGVPLEHVRVLAGDTDFTPVDLGAYSSRVTFMLGNACIEAARKLKAKVREAVAAEWGAKPGEVLLAGGTGGAGGRYRDEHAVARGLQPGRGHVRDPGCDWVIQHAKGCAWDVPWRDDRSLAGVLLHRARGRGRGGRRDRIRDGREDLDRARLRAGAEPGAGGRPDGRFGLHGLRRSAHGGADLQDGGPGTRGAAQRAVAAGLQDPDESRHPRARVSDRRVHRPRGALRGEGSRRRAAPSVDSGHRERNP